MKYEIKITIDCQEALNTKNLREVKEAAENTVIENLKMPNEDSVFINTTLTKEE